MNDKSEHTLHISCNILLSPANEAGIHNHLFSKIYFKNLVSRNCFFSSENRKLERPLRWINDPSKNNK